MRTETGINGSGMHTNLSVSQKGKNLFHDPKGPDKLSKLGWKFIDRILTSGQDICLLFNPSVNAYRRLDPHFEARVRPIEGLAASAAAQDRAARWDGANIHAFDGTYGDYLLGKVSKVFPELRREVL